MTAPAIESIDAIRRRQFIQFTAGALGAVTTGCAPRASATRDSTLIIAFGGPDNGMNPASDYESKLLVFLPLLGWNENGDLQGRLAERWDRSEDYREWTFHLRDNVRWHDGVPVTAHDVKFSFDLLAHPAVGELDPGDVESITILDDRNVRVRYAARSYYGSEWSSNATWEVIFPKHLLEHLDPKTITEWSFWTHPVGNGPYRFVRWVPRTMMEFEANPDYYKGKPRIERVVLKFVSGAELAELRSGNVDVVMGASSLQAAVETGVRSYFGFNGNGDMETSEILWQNANPLFGDVRIRRALTLAIDRRELARLLHLPDDVPIVDGPLTRRQLRRGDLPAPLPYDPAQARALLDAAGWRSVDGAVIRMHAGQPFHFTLLVGNQTVSSQIAVYVQESLRRVGVSVAVEILDGGLVAQRTYNGRFDAVLAPRRIQLYLGSSPVNHNADIVALLEQRRSAMTPDEVDGICRRLTELFRADLPVTFLFPTPETVLARPRVRGLSSPWHADPIRHIDELWLDNRSPT